MINPIRKLIHSKTAADTSYLLSGTVVSNVFGFAVIAILTRSLEPIGFGVFITALTFAQMVADFSELGVNPGSLNYLGRAKASEKNLTLKASLFLRLATSGFAAIFVFCFAKQFALIVFNNLEIVPFIQISAIGALFLSLIAWSQNIFQIESRFLISAVVNSSTNIFRFLAVCFLIYSATLNPISGYSFFQLILILSVAIFFLTHNLGFLKSKFDKQTAKKIFKFGIPIGLSFSLASVYTRLDQIMVFNFLGSSEAGFYGLAARLILILVFVISAFGSALAPRFVQISEKEFASYFKKSLFGSAGLVGVTLISILISPFFIPLIFGDKFIPSIEVFQILALGIIFFIFSIPLNLFLIYRHQKNIFVFIIGGFSLFLTWALLSILIPTYGINGAALTVSLVNLFQFLAYCVYIYTLKKLR